METSLMVMMMVVVVGTATGLQKLASDHPDVEVHVAAVDSAVNEVG